jgi:hypothetical protein
MGQAQLLRKPRRIRFLRFVRDRIGVEPEIAQIGIRYRIPNLAVVQGNCLVQIGEHLRPLSP